MTGRLAVLGAGAKAVAVAAKAAMLREMGVATPEIVAVERKAVAANWRAGGGWTDGQHRLGGTSPEKKDVGFPYRSMILPGRNGELDARMMRLIGSPTSSAPVASRSGSTAASLHRPTRRGRTICAGSPTPSAECR